MTLERTTLKETVTAGEHGDLKLILGWDGSSWRPILVDNTGKLSTAAAFSGTAYSKHFTVSDIPTKFEASSKKLRDIVIRNIDSAKGARIGIYNADKTTFRGTGFTLEFEEAVGFTEIDLNTLAYCSHTDADTPILEIIGVEE